MYNIVHYYTNVYNIAYIYLVYNVRIVQCKPIDVFTSPFGHVELKL